MVKNPQFLLLPFFRIIRMMPYIPQIAHRMIEIHFQQPIPDWFSMYLSSKYNLVHFLPEGNLVIDKYKMAHFV